MSAAMGRPKLHKDDARAVYPLRISKREKAAYLEAATSCNLPLAEWMRNTLTEQAKAIKSNTESGANRT